MIDVHGVDFSGAADAGRKIWIASGRARDGVLCISACRPALALPGGGLARDDALAALRAFIAAAGTSVFGFDFPFAVARELMGAPTWEAFARSFAARFETPLAFRRACLAGAAGRDLRRACDAAQRAPQAAYHQRLYRQTYYGIRDVLAPLVVAERVCVVPMHAPQPGRPWLLEICPAVTLKLLRLYRPYKGYTATHRAARAEILAALEAGAAAPLAVRTDDTLRPVILDDPEGDALDAVIAALAAWRAVRDPGRLIPRDAPAHRLEGHIYA
jgi:hypothetical protein